MKFYKTISTWKDEILRKHEKATFNEHEITIAAQVKTSAISLEYVGFICKGNLKGEVKPAGK